MNKWIKVNGIKEVPIGQWLVLMEENLLFSKMAVASVNKNITTIGCVFAFDAPKVLAYKPLPSEDLDSIETDLIVKVTKMSESNGNTWWSVWLARNENHQAWDGHQVYTDTIEGRAQYEADCIRHFLGQGPKPDILEYKTDE